jgi:hypothetical protein
MTQILTLHIEAVALADHRLHGTDLYILMYSLHETHKLKAKSRNSVCYPVRNC